MSDWFSCKEILPIDNLKVIAKNPFIEAVSWINGKDELGKHRWFHEKWEHADNYVTHWKHRENESIED